MVLQSTQKSYQSTSPATHPEKKWIIWWHLKRRATTRSTGGGWRSHGTKTAWTILTNKNSNDSFTVFEKSYKTNHLQEGLTIGHNLQALEKTHCNNPTDTNKSKHRKLIYNLIPFQNVVIPAKLVNTRMTTAADRTSKTTCGYRRNITVQRQAILLLVVESGTRKLSNVVESRTKFTFDVERVLDSTTVLVLDSTPTLLL